MNDENVEIQYLNLIKKIMTNGNLKKDRTGTGTMSLFGHELRHRMTGKGDEWSFPLLTTKKVSWKTIFRELSWFLKGSSSLRELLKMKVSIWTGDAYKRYLQAVSKLEEPDYLLLIEDFEHEYLSSKQLYERIYNNSSKTWQDYYDYEKFMLDLETGSIKIETFEFMNGFEVAVNSKGVLDVDDQRIYDKIEQLQLPCWRSKNKIPVLRKLTTIEFEERILENDEFNKRFGDLGPIYGRQWRNWQDQVDQVEWLLKEIKTNPDSRRLIVSAWNVTDLNSMILHPCHYGFQVYTRELSSIEKIRYIIEITKQRNLDSTISLKGFSFDLNGNSSKAEEAILNFEETFKTSIPTRTTSMIVNIRSSDVGLGLPYNIASYALLLSMLCVECSMIPEELVMHLGDAHIYNNHISGLSEQIERTPMHLPKIRVKRRLLNDISEFEESDIEIIDYKHAGIISLPLSN